MGCFNRKARLLRLVSVTQTPSDHPGQKMGVSSSAPERPVSVTFPWSSTFLRFGTRSPVTSGSIPFVLNWPRTCYDFERPSSGVYIASLCRFFAVTVCLPQNHFVRAQSAASPAAQYFFNKASFPTGKSPEGIAIADMNGDGRPDLIVANANG